MNWLQFIADLVKSLAWPTTVVVLGWAFREPIGRVLLELTRLKYRGLELDFGRGMKELAKEAKAADIKPAFPKSARTPIKKGSSYILQQAEELVENNPVSAIAVAWQAVEDELLKAVMRLSISPDNPVHLSPFKLIDLLKDQDAIDVPTFYVLNKMCYLRNKAVHHSHEVMVSSADAREFVALANGVVEKLQAIRRN